MSSNLTISSKYAPETLIGEVQLGKLGEGGSSPPWSSKNLNVDICFFCKDDIPTFQLTKEIVMKSMLLWGILLLVFASTAYGQTISEEEFKLCIERSNDLDRVEKRILDRERELTQRKRGIDQFNNQLTFEGIAVDMQITSCEMCNPSIMNCYSVCTEADRQVAQYNNGVVQLQRMISDYNSDVGQYESDLERYNRQVARYNNQCSNISVATKMYNRLCNNGNSSNGFCQSFSK